MKKSIVSLLLAALLLPALAGCGSTTTPEPETPAEPAAPEVSDQSGILADSDAGGTPLSADELDWFEDYTAGVHTYYDEEHNWTVTGATEISCFFTSLYDDPRDMDAESFLQYFPSEKTLSSEDEAEFALVQKKLDWRGGEDGHLFRVEELPVPCHRIPRARLDEVLMKYAGITVDEMHTDWLECFSYVPETDCFYTFTSDFGPGMFVPSYGEKDGDTVTLWSADHSPNNPAVKLTLQRSGEDWHILSHQSAG